MNRAPLADAPPIRRAELHQSHVSLAREAEEAYPGAGWTVHQWWRWLNEALFGRQMRPCRIQFRAALENGFGLWHREDGSITLSCSLLHQDGTRWWLRHAKLGHRFPADVLLRAMTCQYIETVRGTKIGGRKEPFIERLPNSQAWIREIHRLTELMASMEMASMEMRVENRRARRFFSGNMEDGTLLREEVAGWPCSVRPSGYYDADWTLITGG